MPFYTRTGDEGFTDLLGARISKADPRAEMLGMLDETSAFIGLARAASESERVNTLLIDVQRDLYRMMAELAFTSDMHQTRYHMSAADVDKLERETDALEAEVILPPQFIVPGDTVSGAHMDVARTVARRAERVAVALFHEHVIENPEVLRYLNRLSSLLFILGRFEDHLAGIQSTQAKQPRAKKQAD